MTVACVESDRAPQLSDRMSTVLGLVMSDGGSKKGVSNLSQPLLPEHQLDEALRLSCQVPCGHGDSRRE